MLYDLPDVARNIDDAVDAIEDLGLI